MSPMPDDRDPLPGRPPAQSETAGEQIARIQQAAREERAKREAEYIAKRKAMDAPHVRRRWLWQLGVTLLAVVVVVAVLAVMSGCTTTRLTRDMEMQADQPRALGLGAFAGNCIFMCFISAEFTQTEQGGVDRDAPVHIGSHGSVYSGPKKEAPK